MPPRTGDSRWLSPWCRRRGTFPLWIKFIIQTTSTVLLVKRGPTGAAPRAADGPRGSIGYGLAGSLVGEGGRLAHGGGIALAALRGAGPCGASAVRWRVRWRRVRMSAFLARSLIGNSRSAANALVSVRQAGRSNVLILPRYMTSPCAGRLTFSAGAARNRRAGAGRRGHRTRRAHASGVSDESCSFAPLAVVGLGEDEVVSTCGIFTEVGSLTLGALEGGTRHDVVLAP